jgi:hypothetical protein
MSEIAINALRDKRGIICWWRLLHNTATFDIFVSPNGDEMTSINTNEGAAGSFTPSRRVWPK